MPSISTTLVFVVLLAAFWTGLGWPIARRVLPAGVLVLPCAPAIGWAVHTAAALPLFLICGFSAPAISAFAIILFAAAMTSVRFDRRSRDAAGVAASVPPIAYAAAMLLAFVPMLAVLPKIVGDGVLLSTPIFDHAKIALIDEIARSGIPPANPFFGAEDASSRLAYYYGWHFSAAMVARVFALDGWTADAALTGFTAFSSLTMMMGIACWLGRRRSAAILVLPLCLVGSLRPFLDEVFGTAAVDHALSTYPGLAGWLVQASWVPQHLASGVCVVVAALLAGRLADRQARFVVPILALVVSAAFASSTWVGGVLLAAAAPPVGLVVLGTAQRSVRPLIIMRGVIAGLAALLLSLPLLHDQILATVARQTGNPVALHPFEVLGPMFSLPLRRWLDLPAYWVLLLPLTFSVIVLAGPAFLVRSLGVDGRRAMTTSLAAITGVSFVVAWLFISTIGNNDLGWRVILPGVIIMTGAAAAALANAPRKHIATLATMGIALLVSTDGWRVVYDNVAGRLTSDAGRFAEAPKLWAAVRTFAGPTDRIANNPLMLKAMLPWPVDISWAVLAQRRSCFAGWELTRAYAALPQKRITEIDSEFIRMFEGSGTDAEIRDTAFRYGCTLIVITPQDGIWDRQVFEADGLYSLVDAQADWKIFKRSEVRSAP